MKRRVWCWAKEGSASIYALIDSDSSGRTFGEALLGRLGMWSDKDADRFHGRRLQSASLARLLSEYAAGQGAR